MKDSSAACGSQVLIFGVEEDQRREIEKTCKSNESVFQIQVVYQKQIL